MSVQKAIVVYAHVHRQKVSLFEWRLKEDEELVRTLGMQICLGQICVLRMRAHPAMFIGKGWVQKIGDQIAHYQADCVIFDPDLSPLQQRNLEKAWKCRVLDRSAVILEIFGQRARTAAGILQVTLAKLLYQKSRLVRTWTHLERQKGGFGFMGGPGESQLELDRRMLQQKIIHVQEDLEKIKKTRSLHRKARARVPYPIVTLVGYTNAGKSTLFNKLTHAQVGAENRLFETLDPTMRRLRLPSGRIIILSDTVGFISDLPPALCQAFEATLEEVEQADLLLHIRSAPSPQIQRQKEDVLKVLSKLGVNVPIQEVINKADQITDPEQFRGQLLVSALLESGFDELLKSIDDFFDLSVEQIKICTDIENGRLLSWLYANGQVKAVKNHIDSVEILVCLTPIQKNKFCKEFPEVPWTNV